MNNDIFNTKLITSKSNKLVIDIIKLSDKKYRNKEYLFRIDGTKLFLEAVAFSADIKYVILDDYVTFEKEVIDALKRIACKVEILTVSRDVFLKITDEQAPQGIITVCSFFDEKVKYYDSVSTLPTDEKCMIFESIRDPGNLGSIMRSCVAFGIQNLILSDDCVDIYSPKVIRASMGAFFKIKIYIVKDLPKTIEQLRNERRLIATTLKDNSLVLGNCRISRTDIFVFGNEGHGLSDDVIKACSDTLYIPIAENTESLNVSIASAIIMWEIF